jgi:hypothetical protein
MKIDLTRKEYRDLLDILYVAHWVFNAHKVQKDARIERFNQLEQKIFTLSKQMRFENLVEYDTDLDAYFPTREYEDTSAARTFIDEYDNDTFWDELTNRLAERDLLKQMGGSEKMVNLHKEKMLEKLFQLEEYYGDEFTRNGLENLQLRGRNWTGQISKAVH